jgi:hypothetical protein
MPSSWQSMSLRHIHAFKGDIDINVKKINTGLHISVTNAGMTVIDKTIRIGEDLDVQL